MNASRGLWLLALAVLPTVARPTRCQPHSLEVPATVQTRPHKLIAAHRGASYHLPEHTTAAYRLALELQADWIEPDVVASSDGILFCLHTTDLSVTTNVEEVFPGQTWFSPTFNQTSYWSFNFTADEIEQLTVKQRLPQARSTAMDGIWKIPRLEEALQVLNQWNSNDLAQRIPASDVDMTESFSRKPTPLNLAQSGIYIELKEYAMQKDEANLDLVDLLLSHTTTHADLWKPLLQDQCYPVYRFDEYLVPGLVVQSFDVEALSSFHEKWPLHFSDDPDVSTTNTSLLPAAPEPPYVLLLNHHGCMGQRVDDFWYNVGETWRTFLSGIGCDKKCLSDNAEFAPKAEGFKLALHPWTERPEQEYLMDGFEDALAETIHLFCKVPAVQGVFSESVSTAVMAAHIGCDDEKDVSNEAGDEQNDASKLSGTASICEDAAKYNGLYTVLPSFLLGLVMATVGGYFWSRKGKKRYGESQVVAAIEEEGENSLELT